MELRNFSRKSTVDEIRAHFDQDVERFSHLETGQVSAMDAALCLQLITEAAARLCPHARRLLDIGCGAGNYTLRMLEELPGLDCTLVDLSRPMLDRAGERAGAAARHPVALIQGDIRDAPLEGSYDIILAGAVLHHLRDDQDWERVFARLSGLLNAGGCLMIFDLIAQEGGALNQYFTGRYRLYLTEIGGPDYADRVLASIGREDSPRSLICQLDLMKRVGFSLVDVLHKNGPFAAWCGVK